MQFCCCMDLIAATRAEGVLVLLCINFCEFFMLKILVWKQSRLKSSFDTPKYRGNPNIFGCYKYIAKKIVCSPT